MNNEWNGIEVVALRRELTHPMWQRMWQRAGFDPDTIPAIPLDEFKGPGPGVHTLIVLGEEALRSVGDNQDLFRYRGRRYRRYLWDKAGVIICPTMADRKSTRLNSSHRT